jgi:Xaa-Pro aminopeptidase
MLFNSHRAKHIMEEEKLDAIIFCSPENVYYASDFFNIGGYIRERAWAAMIFQDESLEPVLITPSNDVRLARAQTWMKDVRAYAVAELFTDVDKNF